MNMPKLIGIMAEKGFSQRKLANELGVSKNTINAKLRGKSRFDTEEASRLCEILNIEDDALKLEIFLS